MIDGIRGITAVIVIIEVILIMNDDRIVPAMRTVISTIISTMISVIMVIMIGVINSDSHHGKSKKVRRVITVMVRRIVGYVNRRIDVFDHWSRFDYNHFGSGCFRFNRIIALVARISGHGRSRRFGFDHIIFTIQVFIPYNLHRHLTLIIF